MFGKDRSSYVDRDIFSDDEDMEADAFDVEFEEMQRSVLLALRLVKSCVHTAEPVAVPGLLSVKTTLPCKRRNATRRKSGARGRRRRNAATTERRATVTTSGYSGTLLVVC